MKYIFSNAVVLFIFILLRFVKQTVISGFGYKSNLSTQNLDTWNEGNRFCSNFMIIGSSISIIFGLILKCLGVKDLAVTFGITIIFIILSCIFTERHLRKTFKELSRGSRFMCPNCKKAFNVTPTKMFFTAHVFDDYNLECPYCGKKDFIKAVRDK